MRRKILLLSVSLLLILSFAGCSQKADDTANKQELLIGMEAGYPPFNWTQKDDSNGAIPIKDSEEFANGYDVQMAKIVAEKLGRTPVAVKTEWDGLTLAVNSGKIDVIMAGMSPTAERAKEIDFTEPYYHSQLTLVVSADGPYKDAKKLSDFSGAKVVAQLNTFHETVIDQIEGVNKMESMADFPSMRVAVQSGKADAYVAERPEGISSEKAGINLKMIELEDGFKTSPEDTAISIGLKKNNPLLGEMNKIISGIDENQRTKIMDQMIDAQNGDVSTGFFSDMQRIFSNNKGEFLKGTLVTIAISFVGTLIGLLIGMLIGVVKTIPLGNNGFGNALLTLIKWIMNIYVQVLRGTPMIVQSMLFYYGLQQFAGIDLKPLTAAFIVVSVNTGAYMAEVVRGGINSIDKGQFEACSALGMSHFQTMTNVVLPQAFKNIIPSVGNEFIVNIKDTSVLNVISVNELFFTTKSIAGANLKYFQTYLITSLIYLILTLGIAGLLSLLERKLRGKENYELSSRTNVLKSAN